jgi:hypothetical protein
MTDRYRTLDSRKAVSGTYRLNGVVSTPLVGLRGMLQTCEDQVGDWDEDNPLIIDRQSRSFACLDGEKPSLKTVKDVLNHLPILGVALRSFPSTVDGLTTPNLAAMAPIWLGQMTPQARALSLPTFVGELPDLPSLITQIPGLIRHWGRRRGLPRCSADAARALRDGIGDSGSAYLGAKFGWSPFLRDLAEMLGILEAIRANMEMLMRLRSGRSIKRSLRLAPQIVNKDRGTQVLSSTLSTVRARVTQVNSCVHWVTSRWEPLFPGQFRYRNDDDLWREACRTAVGITPGGAVDAWWELLPWSWLVDWFAKVAAWMARFTRNSFLLKCTSFCYMRTSQVHVYFAMNPTDPWVKVSPEQNLLHRVKKERFLLGITERPSNDPSPPALPVLSDGQMGILGALLAQKAKGLRP